ncbi:YaaA family protein [Aliarcobacter lanthieri]|uniref:YaaA family protein n=1 Tax=Aliarcobacter lanthieri TaxID=1355374 RepID=UPI003AA8B4A2
MKILFSPSETKISGGEGNGFDKNSFIFPEFFEKRLEIINSYNKFLQIASNDELYRLFGTKKNEIIEKYRIDIFKNPIMKAIKRYEGVAYDYLSYNNLEESAQKYIDNNVLIFSNLFGVLKASDKIPDYKLKQGETFLNLKIEKFYNDNFSNILDEYLQDEDILDLRAGFYEKFYTIKKPYLTMKFIKDGKVVSHFAKAYRGEILKTLAQNSINTFDDLMNLELKNLKIEEIKEQKFKREIVYSINQG